MSLNVTQQQYDEQVKYIQQLDSELADTIKRIADAKKEGDLSENAQFEAGMRDKERIETALADAKLRLSQMKIVRENITRTRVDVPCKIRVQDLNTDKIFELQIVNTGGMPPDRVSADSKFGALIVGKRVGTVISYVDNAYREQKFKLLEII